MRHSGFLLLFFFSISTASISAASAVDLHIKVVDPNSAAVAGAQVSIYRQGEASPLQVRSTSGEGEAIFRVDNATGLRAQVLAPGFALAWSDVANPSSSATLITLRVATASETVVVSATRTPTPEQETASSVSLLSGAAIETMQPTSGADALRFLPGAVVNVAGQRGGLGSLFVRGGDSRYNKVLIDGVPVTDPGGTFNSSTVPLAETDRLEFVRGAQSTLYGSDAMTSVVQIFTRNGTTETPELRFGADGGTFGTAHGFASLAGARSRFDYNAFADQFNTNGQGPNAGYTNALQGGNVGVQLNQRVQFRLRTRHSNSRTGVPGEWDFNGQRLLAPDIDQRARANNFLASGELLISSPARWQHRLTGYEYNTRRLNEDDIPDRGCDNSQFIFTDCPFLATAHINRAGFLYQGDYTPRSWAQTTVGYEFEDENGRFYTKSVTLDSQNPPSIFIQAIAGLRLNHAAFVQQRLTWKRLSAIAGVRYVHSETSSKAVPVGLTSKAVPRVALTLLAVKGGQIFSGTRLRFSYASGIKEPRFEEQLVSDPPTELANPNLKPEENRAFEAGFEQGFFGGRYQLSGVYFNSLFRNQIDFAIINPNTFAGQYENINRSMAHGAELQLAARLTSRLSLTSAYVYTSSQILVQPSAFDSLHQPGQPLLRRPKHSGSMLLTYLGSRWGANLGGSFVGRRADSDFLFLGFNIDHAAGYARVDLGGWYTINSRITAYANVENALNDHYNEVVGYPALTANFRAGVRFRIGGE
ncbi:MAG TPA: TonB-dependent receptor [Terriglobales bacterium]|nr:TonB-dependent receptor [Terriglobales bacterium]